MIWKSIFVLIAAIGYGCSTTNTIEQDKNLSAGEIGCAPSEIEIYDSTKYEQFKTHNWTAVCKGESYICSYQVSSGASCSLAK